MPRRKLWRLIRVAGDVFHWKVCEQNFESYGSPTTTHPCDVVVRAERAGDAAPSHTAMLRVGFPIDGADQEPARTPATICAIIESALVVGWGPACAERRFWFRGTLASRDQWVDVLRVERPDLPSAVRPPRPRRPSRQLALGHDDRLA